MSLLQQVKAPTYRIEFLNLVSQVQFLQGVPYLSLSFQLLLMKNDRTYTGLSGSSVDILFGVVISIGSIEVIWQEI